MTSTLAHPATSARRLPRRGGQSRETVSFRLGVALVALHVLDDSYLQPQPGTSAGDHLVSGLVPLALLGRAAPENLKRLVPRIAPRPMMLIAAPGSGHGEELNRGVLRGGGRAEGALGAPRVQAHPRAGGATRGVRAPRDRLLRPGAGAMSGGRRC